MLAKTFTEPFGRIFWKEYRVNRALWLSCLLIGFVFLVLVTSFSSVDGRNQGLLAMVAFMPAMYAIGCAALLFAGEREERTSDWLLAVAARPGPTILAKLGFAVVSTIALQIALVPIALALTSNVSVNSPNLLQMYIPYALLVLVWSVFGSLLSRRVLVSVPAMAFWWVVTFLWPMSLLEHWTRFNFRDRWTWHGIDFWQLCAFVCVVTVTALNLWLGWRWCQGRYLDGAIVEDLNGAWERGRNRLLRRTAAHSSIPKSVESEISWRRAWQRLLWQERRRESFHLAILAVGCAVSISMAFGSWMSRDSLTVASAFLVFGIPVAMGVLGFRVDVARSQSRFLADRGVSPESVWLAKQVIWLPRAFWITAVLFLLSVWLERFFLGADRSMHPSEAPLNELYSIVKTHPHRAFWYVLLSYCSGQLAAVLFQRFVLAAAVGNAINVAMASWQACMEALNVPQWWSLGIPVLCMLGITFWQMKPWILEDHSWRQRFKQVIAISATAIALVLILASYRVAEAMITSDFYTNPNFESLAAAIPSQTLTADEEKVKEQLGRLTTKAEIGYIELATEIVELMETKVSSINSLASNQHSALSRNSEFNQLHNDADDASPLANSRFRGGRLQTYLLQSIDERTGTGQLDESLKEILAGLKLERIQATRNSFPQMWEHHTKIQRMILEKVVNWANHPSQTPDSIREARRLIQKELNLYPSATEAIVTHYLQSRRLWVLSSRQEVIEELVSIHGEYVPTLTLAIVMSPTERARFDRLLKLQAQSAFHATSVLESLIRNPAFSAKDTLPKISDEATINSLAQRTLLSRFISISTPQILKAVIDRNTMVRATMLQMELIAYRLELGKLPNRLIELTGVIEDINLVDPWAGQLFQYYPAFLMTAGSQDFELVPSTAPYLQIRQGNFLRSDSLDARSLINDSSEAETSIHKALGNDAHVMSSVFFIPRKPAADAEKP